MPLFRCAVLGMVLLGSVGAAASADEGGDVFTKWWNGYKHTFITSAGRVQRLNQGRDTVSEGQAYAMLLSVLADDRPTFDKLLAWTDNNLSRRDLPEGGDRLLAWHWKHGAIADPMPASDADCDFALALLLAGRIWGDDTLLIYGREVAADILKLEVVAIQGDRLILLPGLWGRQEDGSIIQNPSYYNPAAFRVFHQISGDQRWLRLVDTSYWVWEQSSKSLDGRRGVGLQPDWFMLTPDSRFVPAPDRSTDYGWESVRMPLRIGLDVLCFGDQRGTTLLEHIVEQCNSAKRPPPAVFTYAGEPAVEYDSLAGMMMNHFARELLEPGAQALGLSITAAIHARHSHGDYYGQTLAGFTLALEAKLYVPVRDAATRR